MDENNAFGELDSWAYWKHEDSIIGSDVSHWEYSLKEKYKEYAKTKAGFPFEEHQFANDLSNTNYVLVGMNPGNADKQDVLNYPENFHGKSGSHDYMLQAATHGTVISGAFMTDAIKVQNSNSKEINIDIKAITELYDRLENLNIKDDAKIIFMGLSKFRKPLNKMGGRTVATPIYPEYKLIDSNYPSNNSNPNYKLISTFIENNKKINKNKNPLKYKNHKLYLINHFSGMNHYWNTEEVHAVLNLIAKD